MIFLFSSIRHPIFFYDRVQVLGAIRALSLPLSTLCESIVINYYNHSAGHGMINLRYCVREFIYFLIDDFIKRALAIDAL